MTEFTVVGFIDDSGDVQVAGVIAGRHDVTQQYYSRWWLFTKADSPAEAETLAVSQIEQQLDKDEEEA